MGVRTNKVMKELNIGLDSVVEYLKSVPGLEPEKELKPNTKLSDAQYDALKTRFQSKKRIEEKADSGFPLISGEHKTLKHITDGKGIDINIVGKIDLDSLNQKTRPKKKPREEKKIVYRPQKAEGLSNTDNTVDEGNNLKYKNLVSEKEDEKVQMIALDKLRFGDGFVLYKKGNNVFAFHNKMFSTHLNKYKNDYRIKGITTSIILDYSNGTFSFRNGKILKNLEAFKIMVDNELVSVSSKEIERNKGRKEYEKKEKKVKPKIEQRIPFSALRFGNGMASIFFKKERYVYRDYNIRDYSSILERIYGRVPKTRANRIKTFLIWVVINTESETFTFKDFDINKYVNNLKDSFLPKSKKVENNNEKKVIPQKPSSPAKTITLVAGNIRFYNGYFLIFRTTNGDIDNSLAPYRVNDPDSHEILNLVHNYFEQRFEQMRIVVKHDNTSILEPSRPDLLQLRNYVRALRRNLEVKGEWWEEVQNARKRSFAQCYGESRDSVKSRYIKSKSEYLYNLSSLQNEKKLIRVYEINHGKEEDAFIFTIDMAGNRNAIVFENASNEASTTTWVFVAKSENYEDCINMVFNYFTDYTIHSKRSSLRAKTVNPPEKFKAESYAFIDHDDLEQWLKKLNRVLENIPQPSEVKFVPGLNIPQSSETRSPNANSVTTRNIHNQLMLKLYENLCNESGKENVGTEIRVGTKRIDAVVKGNGFYDIYEVKTASNSFDCVTEALGQICQYAYLYCRDNIGKMVIVGAAAASQEVDQYLAWFRKKHSMEVYYMNV